MYSPEIYSWDVEDTLVLESSVNERCDEKHESLDDKYKGRLGGGTNADHPHIATHNFSRKKAAHFTVGSERVQKNHRKKMLAADKTNKGRTVHNDIAAKVTAKSFNVYRISQPRGSKDRHSKVFTSKGPRDRRMRLSVATAIRLYDLQEKLGLDQPSKTVEWLLRNAQPAILNLPLSAYSNSTGQETSLQSQNLNHLDLYGNILAENSLPASTTESNSNRDAQEGETSAAVMKRRRRDIANPSERKAHRTQARERARQRTREKYGAYESRQLIDHLKTFGLVKKNLGASSSLVQDSILSGCSNSHSSVSHPLSEIRSSLRTTVQQECSSQQSLGSLSCSNLAILSAKSTPDFVPGYFPLSVPCTCCVQCSGLECISEGQSTSNKETLQVADTRNICLIKPFEAHQSSNILTAYSPISCFPSPPFQLLDAGYYAQDCPVVHNCQ